MRSNSFLNVKSQTFVGCNQQHLNTSILRICRFRSHPQRQFVISVLCWSLTSPWGSAAAFVSSISSGSASSPSLGQDDSLGDDASVMASRLDEVVTALLDTHAPMTEITCRVRRSSDKWYDSECLSAKRRSRGYYERRFKRSRTDAARDSWMGALKTMHHLVRSKRKQFWRSRLDIGRDQASLWRVINDGLGRGGDGAPVADPGLSAEAFADYFDRKVYSSYQIVDRWCAAACVQRHFYVRRLSAFVPVTTDVVCTLVRNAADNTQWKIQCLRGSLRPASTCLLHTSLRCSTCRYLLA